MPLRRRSIMHGPCYCCRAPLSAKGGREKVDHIVDGPTTGCRWAAEDYSTSKHNVLPPLHPDDLYADLD